MGTLLSELNVYRMLGKEPLQFHINPMNTLSVVAYIGGNKFLFSVDCCKRVFLRLTPSAVLCFDVLDFNSRKPCVRRKS